MVSVAPHIFADDPTGTGWPLILTAAVAVIGATTAWANAKSDRRLKEQRDAIDYLNAVCNRQEEHIRRQDVTIGQQQIAIHRQHQRDTKCRETVQELYGYLRVFHLQIRMLTEELRGRGATELPTIPDMPTQRELDEHEAEFMVRDTAEASQLNRDLGKRMPTTEGTA